MKIFGPVCSNVELLELIGKTPVGCIGEVLREMICSERGGKAEEENAKDGHVWCGWRGLGWIVDQKGLSHKKTDFSDFG